MSAPAPPSSDQFSITTRRYRRTALVEVRGELDLCTRPQVAGVLEDLQPEPGAVRHVVLDLRGLTFMDAQGAHELVKQADFARENHHNFAVVKGRKAIQRVLELTAAEERLVLVDEPEDLAPPQPLHAE
jgi:anti-sigma B factor antagonist